MNPIVAVTMFLWLVNGHTAVVSVVVPPGVTCERAIAVEKDMLDKKHVELGVAAARFECGLEDPPTGNTPIEPTPPSGGATQDSTKPVDPAPHGVHQDDGTI